MLRERSREGARAKSSSTGELAATCRGLVKIYWSATGEVHALKGIDAEFPSASLTAVVGPSGSGKSSLLRILAALDRATAGTVRVGRRELSALRWDQLQRTRRRVIGYVFQRPSDNLIPYLTVEAHLRTAARIRRPLRRPRFDELLEMLGLGRNRDALPHHLSGGEQQRLAFAQAVVADPLLVVADEPTAELDSETALGLLSIMRSLARRGVALVVATHDPTVIREADRAIYLRHGAVEAEAREDRTLSVIDADGRIQIPPAGLRLFPDRRAVIRVDDGGLRIDPPWSVESSMGPAPSSPFLEARDVWKSYRRGPELVRALAAISLSLSPGEVVALVGRSGSGKTTLLNVLCGWERPDRGDVVWGAGKAAGTGAAGAAGGQRPWSDLAIVPQGLGLLEELSVEENVELPLRLARDGLGEREVRRRVPALLKALGLDRLADRTPQEISMGEQQRAALARALVVVPTLLLADEPTGHQDEGWARGVFTLLRMAARRGVCCLVATHNTEAIRFADRVLHIRDGELTGGTADEGGLAPAGIEPQVGTPTPRGRVR